MKSESEIKKMTKTQLKQWLTKHDQRLPPQEKLKKYYLERAIKYFHLLQQQNSSSNLHKTNNTRNITQRSRSKKKKPILSNARTKKKTHSHSNSLTPKKNRNLSPPSPHQTRSRSKKRVIRVVRKKTPSRQSPSILRSLKKKRAKMRRATADPHNLSQFQAENDAHSSSENESDDDVPINDLVESENGGDYYNNNKYILDEDPEKMTISRLQQWLDEHNITFLQGRKKQTYVNLVKRYSSKKRNLSPRHKKHYSPSLKKPKSNKTTPGTAGRIRKRYQSYAAPLPSNLRKSPLTPHDDEKSHTKTRLKRKSVSSEHLLLTPALNKTGVSRIDTPSKAQMRDEIRNLLELDADGDTDPLYPVGTDVTPLDGITPGITPGGPSNYDPGVLNNVLSDLRRHKKEKPMVQKARRKSMEVGHVYKKDICDVKHDEKIKRKPSESFFNSIIAKFSPHRVTSPQSMQHQVSNVLAVNNTKKKHKNSYVAKRTVPSPVTPQEFNDMNDDDHKVNGMTPLTNYQQKLRLNESGNSTNTSANVYYDDEPMSPANTQCVVDQNKIENNVRRSIKKPIVKKKSESPAIVPSIPSFEAMKKNQKNLSPHKLPFERKEKEIKKVSNKSRCKAVIRILFLALFGAAIACFFAVFDGMEVINDRMNLLSDFLNNYGVEDVVFFCDSGKMTINGGGGDCRRCPFEASFCSNGEAVCKTNYILQDDKCILDGVVVKIAYDLKKQIHKILADKKGKYECGEDEGEGYTMTGDELIANLVVIDESKKDEAFAYFNKNIVPDSSIISMNAKGEYFSYKSSKSALCKMTEWAVSNVLGLISGFIIMFVVFSMWCKYKRKKWEKKEIDAMVGKIYNILDEFERFNKQRYVPIDVIKQRIKPKSNKLWKCVDTLIQKDINIQKSIRMIDGMQKRCLALSTMQSSMNNHNNRPWSQSQSQSQPAQAQQQWNFSRTNSNNNSNQYDADGFNFERSNQMAHSNNFENNHDQTRFPPHSKRGMF